MKLVPACSPFNSEQPDQLFRYIDRVFVMHGIPEGNNVTLTGKIERGQTGPVALNDIGKGKEAL